MKRPFAALCLTLAILFSGFFQPFLHVAAQSAPPPQTSAGAQTIKLAGLRAPVTVRRDERGIPYIEAGNDADLYLAQGYITASDRLWEMDFLRRTARGELAEIFGKAVLEEDKRHRIYGFARLSEESVGRVSPQMRAALEAYARGVNAFIESRPDGELPVEFNILQYKPRPWTPADSLIMGKLLSETLSTTWQTDLMRSLLSSLPAAMREALLPDSSPLDVLVVGSDQGSDKKPAEKKTGQEKKSSGAFFDESKTGEMLAELARIRETTTRSLKRAGLYAENHAASNNWVVSGAHTATGKPLLANDPHLPASAPSIWHMASLKAPGLRVAGVTIPGVPGIILGHNEQIAWGATNLGPDVQDLYSEKFDASQPGKYLTPEGWRAVEVRREEIRVRKDFTSSATETVPLDVKLTRHGPIVFEKGGARYALRWTALDAQAVEFDRLYQANRARNWKEFRAAFRGYPGPTQNFVYADTAGHIGYIGAGRIPIRKSGDGSVPYDGSTDAGEWTSFIPFDKLPQAYDPSSGIIVTANQRVIGRSYPYFLTHDWATPYRARRILDLLQAKPKLDAEDFRAIQGDTYSYEAEIFVREAARIAHETPAAEGDEKWREAVHMLEGWDRHMDADSRAALLAILMRDNLRRRLVRAALGPELAKEYGFNSFVNIFVDRVLAERSPQWLPKEFKNYAELLRASYMDTRAEISKTLKDDESQWTWGRFRQMRFRHPLAGAPLVGLQFAVTPLPQHGSISSINVGQNVSMRLIADVSNWDRTRQGIGMGESGDPSSPHWKDQLADWRAVSPRVFPFSDGAVLKAAKETLLLAPAVK
ncbi:MAG TPA: penicillin acylase family protein [Pyrinomonadaceae bacterium]|jgi:penicillin amidase